MNDSTLLRDASVQEIQLELLRRTEYNALHGARVYAGLLRHRDRWIAVVLDRPGLPDYRQPGRLLALGLIKLRDLSGNFWNADTLFILTKSHERAQEFARIIEDEDWGGEVQVYAEPDEIDSALGTSEEYGLLSVWWD
ncbi:MAG TPA: hypothetical protein VFJ58_26660 [Armatimonadota bacterium]|nr:hypothetical protein [Armatimonadota bacterium]